MKYTKEKEERKRTIITRSVVFSGHPPSPRVTVPPAVKKQLKLEKSDNLAFILTDELIMIENPARLVPDALKDEPVLFVLKLINERLRIDQHLSKLKEKYLKEEISWSTWRKETDKTIKRSREIEQMFKDMKEKGEKLPEFALKFIGMGSMSTSDLTAFLEEECLRERENMIIDGIEQLKEEEKTLSDLLKKLDRKKEKGEINRKEYNQFKKGYELRLRKIRDIQGEIVEVLGSIR